MNKFYTYFICSAATASLTMFSAYHAHSEEDYSRTTISNAPESGVATISGKVANVSNDRKFTLKDETGTVDVLLSRNPISAINKGDSVIVSGDIISKSSEGKSISANMLVNEKDYTILLPTDSANASGVTKINALPKSGLVKVRGIVDSIDGDKLVIKDNTGAVIVRTSQGSSNTGKFQEGSEVIVIGSVNSKLFTKDIKAERISLKTGVDQNAKARQQQFSY